MDYRKLLILIKVGIFAALITPLIKSVEFYFPYVGPKSLYFMAVAEIVFFLWVVLSLGWKQYRVNLKNPLIIAILAFLAISIAAALGGANLSASFWSKFERMGGVLMLSHLAAFAVVAASVMERRDWVRLFCASIGIATVVALITPFDKSTGAGEGGMIGNNSFWGTYLLFNIFIALYIFVSAEARQRKIIKYFSAAAFLITAASLMMVGTQHLLNLTQQGVEPTMGLAADILYGGARAAKLSFLGGLGLFALFWFSFAKNRIARILSRAILVSGLAAVLVAVAMAIQPGNKVYQFMVDNFREGSVRGRLVVWETGWKGFLERPILGWGPENFNLVFARYYNPCTGSPECSGETWFDRAHNIVVDTLVETGVVGLIGYLAIFGAALYLLWRPVLKSGAGLAEAAVFSAMFAAYFVQNLTVFDMVVSYLMFYLCLAFIISDRRAARGLEKNFPVPTEPSRVMTVAAAGIICFYYFVAGPFWTDYNTVVAARAPYGTDEKIGLYSYALGASPAGKYQIRMFFANQWIMGLQEPEVLKTLTVGGLQKTFVYLAGELEKSRRESPYDFQSRLRLGQLYNSWGFFDPEKLALAEEVLNQAMALSPNNPQSYWELSQTRIQQKRIDDARALVRQAYDLYPGNPKAVSMLEKVEKLAAPTTIGGEVK